MNKISVGRTVAEAYGFAFGRLLGNLGVVWVPVLFVMAAAFYLLPAAFTSWAALLPNMPANPVDPADLAPMMQGMIAFYRVLILFWVAAILLRAEMMLGLTRRALGLSTGPSLVFLSVGKPFWRLAGSYFAVTIILMTAEMVLVIAFAIAGIAVAAVVAIAAHGDKTLLAALAGLGVGIGVLSVLCALFYIAVRLTFLLTPVIVAEERFDLIRPWQMARGNFWRIFAIGIAVFVPLGLLMAAAYLPLEFAMLAPLMHAPAIPAQDPQAAAKMFEGLVSAMEQMVRTRWFILVPLGLLGSALLYGIAAGAAASAYRGLMADSQSATAA